MDYRLEFADVRFGEEGRDGGASQAVEVVIDCCEGAIGLPEEADGPGVFVSFLAACCVQFLVEIGVIDVEFVWADSDYWTCHERYISKYSREFGLRSIIYRIYRASS